MNFLNSNNDDGNNTRSINGQQKKENLPNSGLYHP